MILSLLIIICAAGLLIVIIGLIRNEKVYRFRQHIADNYIFNDPEAWQQKLRVYKKVSYEEMAFNLFKPLKFESWWNENDSKILLNSEPKVKECDASKAQETNKS